MERKNRQKLLVFPEPIPQKNKINRGLKQFKKLGEVLKIQVQRENIEAIKEKTKKILKKS